MVKKIVLAGVVLSFACFILGMGAGAARAEIVLKGVTAWPKTATEYKAFTIFTDTVDKAVAKKAPGQLKIRFIGGPEAVKTPDQVQAAQRGMVDLVFTTNAYYVSIIPEVDALKLSDYTPSEERANGAWAYMNELHKKQGLYYLGRLGIQIPFQLFLKKPIKAADLHGLNIRVSPMYLQAIKGLGGNPVVIPPTDVYIALERNVVDGYCWPEVGIRDWGWQKQTKYMVEPTFYTGPNPLVMNLKTFEKLPKNLQDVLTEATAEAEKEVVAYYRALAKTERSILTKEGIETITLPPAERDKFLKIAYDEGWKDIMSKNPKTGAELKKLLSKKK
jgi:TRAP-type C4-dicarboxylate transport system substrate-binding protein